MKAFLGSAEEIKVVKHGILVKSASCRDVILGGAGEATQDFFIFLSSYFFILDITLVSLV